MKKKLIAIALFSLSIAACKQGLGERCQVSADCATPLTCNQASMICVSSNDDMSMSDVLTPPADAVPIDAAPDAPPIDAAPDGP